MDAFPGVLAPVSRTPTALQYLLHKIGVSNQALDVGLVVA